jgi:hypothetical protein
VLLLLLLLLNLMLHSHKFMSLGIIIKPIFAPYHTGQPLWLQVRAAVVVAGLRHVGVSGLVCVSGVA